MRYSRLIGLVVFAAACGGSGGGDTTSPPTGGPPTNTTPVFTSLTLAPPTLNLAVGATTSLTATGRDQNGNAMSGLPAATFSTSDAAKASVNTATGAVTGVAATGSSPVTITATVASGGTTRTATSQVNVLALLSNVTVTMTAERFAVAGVNGDPPVFAIPRGTTVTFTNNSATDHNVVFNSAAVPDIPTHRSGTNTRTFGTAGTYPFTCTLHSGMNGTILVP